MRESASCWSRLFFVAMVLLPLGCGRSGLRFDLSDSSETAAPTPAAPRPQAPAPQPPATGGSPDACTPPCAVCSDDGPALFEGSVRLGPYASMFDLVPLGELAAIREITGNLSVLIPPGREQDLAALSCLESVGGDLSIQLLSPDVHDLRWLSSLQSVGGKLSISGIGLPPDAGTSDLVGLTSLHGLAQLTQVGALEVVDHPSLSTLVGLESLIWIGGLRGASGFTVMGNANLSSLNGVQGLTVLFGDLSIIDNPKLIWCDVQALSVRLGNACDCPPSGSRDGGQCSCVDGCKCTGNDNTAARCQ